MPRLLIVSPHFPPVSAADHHRVRMALPYLLSLGWEVEVIAVHPINVRAPCDHFLEQTIPPAVRVHRVQGLSKSWARIPSLGSLGYRCTGAIRQQIVHCLQSAGPTPDIIYFSTTQFPVHSIIPGLKARYNIPIVIDYQDLWVSDYYLQHRQVRPPGGRLKYWLARKLDQWQERSVIGHVDAFTSVSPAYPDALKSRYPCTIDKPFLVLPFGAAEGDLATLQTLGGRQKQFTPTDGFRHWVYIGRGGADMAQALHGFFSALQRARLADPSLSRVRLHFLGTDYAPGTAARPSILPVAQVEQVADLVVEQPQRLPYSEALQCLLDADALVVPGSDDPSYTASKIYPYILARKPLLAIFHESSSVTSMLATTKAGCCITFNAATPRHILTEKIVQDWFIPRVYQHTPATDWTAFAPYTAAAMTSRLDTLFRSQISKYPHH